MKQLLTYEKELVLSEKIAAPVYLSLTKYTDCLVILLNQTGAIGSILEGNVTESGGMAVAEDQEDWSGQQKAVLYEMRVLFGSSEIQFYEILLRRIMSLIWQQLKVKDYFRVLFNVSLPVLNQNFEQQAYYGKIVQLVREGLPAVL